MPNQNILINHPDILFDPWVGEQYGSQNVFGIPILVFGHSNKNAAAKVKGDRNPHFKVPTPEYDGIRSNIPGYTCDTGDLKDACVEAQYFTRHMINLVIQNGKPDKSDFYNCIQSAFGVVSVKEPKEFWNSISFSEYFQDWDGQNTSLEELNRRANNSFTRIVKALKPGCVIMFSKYAYDRASEIEGVKTCALIEDITCLHSDYVKAKHSMFAIGNTLVSWAYHPTGSRRGGRNSQERAIYARPIVDALINAAVERH